MRLALLFLVLVPFALAIVGPNMLLGNPHTNTPTCVWSLQTKPKENPLGVIGSVDLAFKAGFNAVFVPIQKTKDNFPRMVVSTDETIATKTMMQVSQNYANQGEFVPLLGEFLGSTSSTIEVILVPVQSPNDVDMIIHELSQTTRDSSSVVLVIPEELAYTSHDGSDALSRFRSLVPDGQAMIYFENYTGHWETPVLARKMEELKINIMAVPASKIDNHLIDMCKGMGIHVGAFGANTRAEITKMLGSDISFFTSSSPITYLDITGKKNNLPVYKSHAAIMLG